MRPIALAALAAVLSATAAAAPPPVFVFDGDGAFNLVLIPQAVSDAESPSYVAPDVKAGTPYRRVDLSGPGETFKASGPGRLDAEHCGAMGELPFVPFDKLPSSDAPYVLVPGDWAAMPKVVPQSETGPYLAIVADYLKTKGATEAKPLIRRVFRADLDGDGTDEEIIEAARYGDQAMMEPKAGEYSAVLLRKAGRDGKARTIELSASVILAPPPGEEQADFLTTADLAAIADLDGDGRFEIVTYGGYYEGAYAEAWRLKPDGTVEAGWRADCGA